MSRGPPPSSLKNAESCIPRLLGAGLLLALGMAVQVVAHRLKSDSRMTPSSRHLFLEAFLRICGVLSQATSLCFLSDARGEGCWSWSRCS